MDFFGIGHAIKAAILLYGHPARGTGYTTKMLESLKDGDRVIFMDAKEADRVRRMCNERGLNVECIVGSISGEMFLRGTSRGRTIFDHALIEKYYLSVIERAQEDIDYLEANLSMMADCPHENNAQR